MTLLESLFHSEMLLALSLFAVVSVLVEIGGYKLLLAVSDIGPTSWIMSHIIIPAARTLALVAFILVAYPVLFGINTEVSISDLLATGKMRFTHLVNVVFFLSLLLPVLPIFSRWPALVLPLQGIAAATMLFRWWASTQPAIDIQFWPGWSAIGAMCVLAFITHEIAKQLSHQLEKWLDTRLEIEGTGTSIYRTVVMIMQVPVILMYSLSLGEQFR